MYLTGLLSFSLTIRLDAIESAVSKDSVSSGIQGSATEADVDRLTESVTNSVTEIATDELTDADTPDADAFADASISGVSGNAGFAEGAEQAVLNQAALAFSDLSEAQQGLRDLAEASEAQAIEAATQAVVEAQQLEELVAGVVAAETKSDLEQAQSSEPEVQHLNEEATEAAISVVADAVAATR